MPNKKKKEETELKDIKTGEVSLVDRAANRKEFAIVKRDSGGDGMSGTVAAEKISDVIKGIRTAIESLSSLSSNLEESQTTDEEDRGISKGGETPEGNESPLSDNSTETILRAIEILKSTLPNPAPKEETEETVKPKDEDKKGDGEETTMDVAKALKEELEKLSKRLDGIDEKLAKTEETPADDKEPKTDDKADSETDETPAAAPAFDEKKFKEEVLGEVKKALDERATELVKMFQEAAKDQFSPVVKKVETIEKALSGEGSGEGGEGGTEETPAEDDYVRTFGREEGDAPAIDAKDNPFASVFNTLENY